MHSISYCTLIIIIAPSTFFSFFHHSILLQHRRFITIPFAVTSTSNLGKPIKSRPAYVEQLMTLIHNIATYFPAEGAFQYEETYENTDSLTADPIWNRQYLSDIITKSYLLPFPHRRNFLKLQDRLQTIIQKTNSCTSNSNLGSITVESSVRVLQLNMLADGLSGLRDDLGAFSRISSAEINWSNRRYLLLHELLQYDPDIITLQECDHFYDWFLPLMTEKGYAGLYAPKPASACLEVHENSDGCAIFVRKSKLLVSSVESITYSLSRADLTDPEYRSSLSNDERVVRPQNQVALIALCNFVDKSGNIKQDMPPLIIATTHLKAAKNGKGELFRTKEVSQLLSTLEQIMRIQSSLDPLRREPLLLLTGDLNASPQISSKGYLPIAYNTLKNHALGLVSVLNDDVLASDQTGELVEIMNNLEKDQAEYKLNMSSKSLRSSTPLFRESLLSEQFLYGPDMASIAINFTDADLYARVPSFPLSADNDSTACNNYLRPLKRNKNDFQLVLNDYEGGDDPNTREIPTEGFFGQVIGALSTLRTTLFRQREMDYVRFVTEKARTIDAADSIAIANKSKSNSILTELSPASIAPNVQNQQLPLPVPLPPSSQPYKPPQRFKILYPQNLRINHTLGMLLPSINLHKPFSLRFPVERIKKSVYINQNISTTLNKKIQASANSPNFSPVSSNSTPEKSMGFKVTGATLMGNKGENVLQPGPWTTWKVRRKGDHEEESRMCIDYILYSPPILQTFGNDTSSVNCTQLTVAGIGYDSTAASSTSHRSSRHRPVGFRATTVLDLLPLSQLGAELLPNARYPSDHLAIAADLDVVQLSNLTGCEY